MNRLAGPLGQHLDRALAQLDADTPYTVDLVVQDVVLDPNGRRECDDYSGDLSGRWLELAARAREAGRRVNPDKEQAVLRRVLAAQQPDGSFGPGRSWVDTDHGVIWGNGRLLMGLLAQQSIRDDARLDEAVERLVAHLVAVTPIWLRWYSSNTNRSTKFALDFFSILQPLARLAVKPGAPDALTEAVQRLADAVPYAPPAGYHTHGYLLALRGALEWFAATGDAAGIAQVLDGFNRVSETTALPHGATHETIDRAAGVNTEGCGAADLTMLALELNAATGDASLLDTALRVTVNGLIHLQQPSGHFGCETITADPGLLTVDYWPEAWWCCTFHCALALVEVANHAVQVSGSSAHVAIAIDVETPQLTVSGGFPWADRVVISHVAEIDEITAGMPGGYRLGVDGNFGYRSGSGHLVSKPGDVDAILDFEAVTWISTRPGRFESSAPSTTDAGDPLDGRRAAVMRGALLYAADAGINDPADLLRLTTICVPASEFTMGFAPTPLGTVALRAHGNTRVGSLRLRPLLNSFGMDHGLIRVEFASAEAVTVESHDVSHNSIERARAHETN